MDISTGALLAGHLGPHDLRRLQAFVAEHRHVLLAAFEAARRHRWPDTLGATEEDLDE